MNHKWHLSPIIIDTSPPLHSATCAVCGKTVMLHLKADDDVGHDIAGLADFKCRRADTECEGAKS